jgi:hypothetical protein
LTGRPPAPYPAGAEGGGGPRPADFLFPKERIPLRVLPLANPTTDRGKAWRTLGLALYIPIVLVVAPVVGYFGGQWLDRQFGTGSWLAWLGILLGFAAAARQIYHIVRRIQRELEDDET